MGKMNPQVTVLMPVYNTPEKFLRDAIESILEQTYLDFEFLIINDGSHSSIREVILSYQDYRIRYEENKTNIGTALTRNKGFSLARGKYLAVMDSDDIAVPDRLEKQVDFLDTHPEYGVHCGALQYIGLREYSDHEIDIDHEEMKFLLTLGDYVAHPTVMMRLSTIQEKNILYNGYYKFADDYDFFCRLIFYTKFFNSCSILLYYRFHGDNISIQHKKAQCREAQEIKTRYLRKLYEIPIEMAQCLTSEKPFFSKFLSAVFLIHRDGHNFNSEYAYAHYSQAIYESFMRSWKLEYIEDHIFKTYQQTVFYKKLSLRRKSKMVFLSFLNRMYRQINP